MITSDMLTSTPHYYYKECMETIKENSYFDDGDLKGYLPLQARSPHGSEGNGSFG